MTRFKPSTLEVKNVPFTINPVPNTNVHGRPQMQMQWEPRYTENQHSYQYPDGRKIPKLPWIKQC